MRGPERGESGKLGTNEVFGGCIKGHGGQNIVERLLEYLIHILKSDRDPDVHREYEDEHE